MMPATMPVHISAIMREVLRQLLRNAAKHQREAA